MTMTRRSNSSSRRCCKRMQEADAVAKNCHVPSGPRNRDSGGKDDRDLENLAKCSNRSQKAISMRCPHLHQTRVISRSSLRKTRSKCTASSNGFLLGAQAIQQRLNYARHTTQTDRAYDAFLRQAALNAESRACHAAKCVLTWTRRLSLRL